jgi:hypothetical protein
MKTIKLIVLLMLLSFSILAQEKINLNTNITVQLPIGAIVFDDKEYIERYKEGTNSIPGLYLLMISNFVYKKEEITIRFFPGRTQQENNYLQEMKKIWDKPFPKPSIEVKDYYRSSIKTIGYNQCLVMRRMAGNSVGTYDCYVYNPVTKNNFRLEVEYGLNKKDEKKAKKMVFEILKTAEIK